MEPNASRFVNREPTATGWHSTARHCLVLTLIGLAAIAAAIMLPLDDSARPAQGRGAQTPELASEAAVENVLLPGAGTANSIDPAGMPFDYLPAQFPAPQGEIEEQPPTF